MRKYFITAALLFAGVALFAQQDTSYWKTKGSLGINISQTSFTNWATGGDNTFAYNGIADISAIRTRGRSLWENKFQMSYGEIGTGPIDNLYFKKADDYIGLFTKFGYKASKSWLYTVFMQFTSQIAPAYDYGVDPNKTTPISNFLSPGVAVLGLGMDYKPNESFSLFVSPATARLIIVLDDSLAARGAFGVKPAGNLDALGNLLPVTGVELEINNTRLEMGALAEARFKKDIMENINLESGLGLFMNYLENIGNVDIDWRTVLIAKVNKYVNVSLRTTVLYDHDTKIKIYDSNGTQTGYGPRVQFKEVIAVGFLYTFEQ